MHYKRQRAGRPLVDDRPEVGSPSGHGRYGLMDHDDESIMCHECGEWVGSVGSHLRRHEMTAREYRARHGIPAGVPLTPPALSRRWSEAARSRIGTPGWQRLEAARDPAAASAARDVDALRSTRAVAESRAEVARRVGKTVRRGRVDVCEVCGAKWCPLPGGYGRRICGSSGCSREWASINARMSAETRFGALRGRDSQIWRLVDEGVRRADVAELYGLTQRGVGIILARETERRASIPHGPSGYRRGCRCRTCRDGHADDERRRNARA